MYDMQKVRVAIFSKLNNPLFLSLFWIIVPIVFCINYYFYCMPATSDSWYISFLLQQEIINRSELKDGLSQSEREKMMELAKTRIILVRRNDDGQNVILKRLDDFNNWCINTGKVGVGKTNNTWLVSSLAANEGTSISDEAFMEGLSVLFKTELFIAQLNPEYYIQRGTDFGLVRFDPNRLDLPAEKAYINSYDYEKLQNLTDQFVGVDRARVLTCLYEMITKEAQTNQEKYFCMLRFVDAVSYEGYLNAFYENGNLVSDPLLLLEVNEMRCGHSARLAVDLFNAGGYSARLVLLNGHTLAEVFYDNSWHYFDPTSTFYGRAALIDGEIPSVAELSRNPFLLERYQAGTYLSLPPSALVDMKEEPMLYYYAHHYFAPSEQGGQYLYKTANLLDTMDMYYGWYEYKIEMDTDIITYDQIERNMRPSIPWIQKIEIINTPKSNSVRFKIQWSPSLDPNNDRVGYLAYLGSYTRGWYCDGFRGKSEYKQYASGTTYTPESYFRRAEELPQDIGVIDTAQTEIEIDVPKGGTIYVSIAAYDSYGKDIGCTLYFPTSEIKLVA